MVGSINKVILVGNLGADPRVNTTQNGSKVVTLSVATSDTWKDKLSGERKERTEVATLKVTTLLPFCVVLTRGSAPRFPTKMTLLILPTIILYLYKKLTTSTNIGEKISSSKQNQ